MVSWFAVTRQTDLIVVTDRTAMVIRGDVRKSSSTVEAYGPG